MDVDKTVKELRKIRKAHDQAREAALVRDNALAIRDMALSLSMTPDSKLTRILETQSALESAQKFLDSRQNAYAKTASLFDKKLIADDPSLGIQGKSFSE